MRSDPISEREIIETGKEAHRVLTWVIGSIIAALAGFFGAFAVIYGLAWIAEKINP